MVEAVKWEHPEYGEATVYCEWELLPAVGTRPVGWAPLFRWRVVAVEFDMFCPPAEQAVLMESLKADEQAIAHMRALIAWRYEKMWGRQT